MKKRSREINVFSVSALDLFASALGAFILMALIFMVFFSMTSRDAGESEEIQAALERCEAQLAAAQTRSSALESQLAAAEARSAEMEEQLAQTVDSAALQACRSQLAEAQAALAESEHALAACLTERDAAGGLAEQLQRAEDELENCQRALQKTFVLVIASWSSSDDVDLHVVDPAGREFYYQNRRAAGSPAALEEDNTHGPGNEVWLHPAADPGRYRVCYKLYRGSPTATVRGSILWQEGKIEIPNLGLTRVDQVRLAVEVLVDENGRITLDRSRSGQVLGTGGCR